MILALFTNLKLFGTLVLTVIFIKAAYDRYIKKSEQVDSSEYNFVKRVSLAAVTLVTIIVIFNYVVNPVGLFPTRLIPPIVATTRLDKVRMWSAYTSPPQIVVMGSSRSFTMSPSYISRVTNKTAFNASVSGGTPRDFYAFIKYSLVHNGKPDTLILGLGLEQFQNTNLTENTEAGDPLADYIDEPKADWIRIARDALSLVSFEHTQASARSLLSVFVGRPTLNYRFDPDGQGHFLQAGNVEYFVERFLSNPGDMFPEPDQKSLRTLGRIIQLCHEENINLIFSGLSLERFRKGQS